jgi:hypothetical protein
LYHNPVNQDNQHLLVNASDFTVASQFSQREQLFFIVTDQTPHPRVGYLVRTGIGQEADGRDPQVGSALDPRQPEDNRDVGQDRSRREEALAHRGLGLVGRYQSLKFRFWFQPAAIKVWNCVLYATRLK